MTYLQEEEKEKRASKKALKEETEKNEISLSILGGKLSRLIAKENQINDKIDPLEVIVEKDRTEVEQKMLNKYLEQLEVCETELENIEDQFEELEIKLERANENQPNSKYMCPKSLLITADDYF